MSEGGELELEGVGGDGERRKAAEEELKDTQLNEEAPYDPSEGDGRKIEQGQEDRKEETDRTDRTDGTGEQQAKGRDEEQGNQQHKVEERLPEQPALFLPIGSPTLLMERSEYSDFLRELGVQMHYPE
eukprot:50114-Hanusia_phi.AAC.4